MVPIKSLKFLVNYLCFYYNKSEFLTFAVLFYAYQC